jgi:hypothetical protein
VMSVIQYCKPNFMVQMLSIAGDNYLAGQDIPSSFVEHEPFTC